MLPAFFVAEIDVKKGFCGPLEVVMLFFARGRECQIRIQYRICVMITVFVAYLFIFIFFGRVSPDFSLFPLHTQLWFPIVSYPS